MSSGKEESGSFRILQWNVCSCNPATATATWKEVRRLADAERANMVVLQETWLDSSTPNDEVMLQLRKGSDGWDTTWMEPLRSDRLEEVDKKRGGGVMTLTRLHPQYKVRRVQGMHDLRSLQGLDRVDVEVIFHDKALCITNVYAPPWVRDDSHTVRGTCDPAPAQIASASHRVIIGDVNAHHVSWSPGKSTARGWRLREWMDGNDFEILNGVSTPTRPASMSSPDVVMTHNKMRDRMTCQVLTMSVSDHAPLLTELKVPYLNGLRNQTPVERQILAAARNRPRIQLHKLHGAEEVTIWWWCSGGRTWEVTDFEDNHLVGVERSVRQAMEEMQGSVVLEGWLERIGDWALCVVLTDVVYLDGAEGGDRAALYAVASSARCSVYFAVGDPEPQLAAAGKPWTMFEHPFEPRYARVSANPELLKLPVDPDKLPGVRTMKRGPMVLLYTREAPSWAHRGPARISRFLRRTLRCMLEREPRLWRMEGNLLLRGVLIRSRRKGRACLQQRQYEPCLEGGVGGEGRYPKPAAPLGATVTLTSLRRRPPANLFRSVLRRMVF